MVFRGWEFECERVEATMRRLSPLLIILISENWGGTSTLNLA